MDTSPGFLAKREAAVAWSRDSKATWSGMKKRSGEGIGDEERGRRVKLQREGRGRKILFNTFFDAGDSRLLGMRRDRGVVCGCVLRRTVDETRRSVKYRGEGN